MPAILFPHLVAPSHYPIADFLQTELFIKHGKVCLRKSRSFRNSADGGTTVIEKSRCSSLRRWATLVAAPPTGPGTPKRYRDPRASCDSVEATDMFVNHALYHRRS